MAATVMLRVATALAVLLPCTARTEDKSGVKPQVISLPSGPGSIEGLGPSFEPQLNTGSASYSIKIVMPPGVVGHQPDLALQYNSGSGNGAFGLGWSLPLQAISRKTDKGQPQYDDSDVFEFSNGEDLVPLSDGTWRCENEAEFLRFRRVDKGWEALDRSGRTYRLGRFPATGSIDDGRVSRVETGGAGFADTYKWYVDEFEDTNGNKVEFFYSKFPDSPGQLYLSEARYNVTDRAYNSVTFDYEGRADAVSNYRGGFEMRTGRRAFRIAVWTQGVLVREYRLEYDASVEEDLDTQAVGAVPLAQSLLTKVTAYGDDGVAGSALPPLRFGYTRLYTKDHDNVPVGNFPGPEDVDLNSNRTLDAAGVQTLQNPPLDVVLSGDGSADLLDVDGDGLPDVLVAEPDRHSYYRNLGGGQFSERAAIGGVNPGLSLESAGVTLADIDGDGLSDLLKQRSADEGELVRNRGDGTWAAGVGFDPAPAINVNDSNVRLVDINGDNATDIIRSDSGSEWEVCINGNDTDADLYPYNNSDVLQQEDIDHDGNKQLDGPSWECTSRVVPFAQEGWAEVQFGGAADVQLADMNGDRLQDMVYLQFLDATSRAVLYWPSMGDARFGEQVLMSASATGSSQLELGGDGIGEGPSPNLRVVDVTADGLADIVLVENGSVKVWINLGGGTWNEPATFTGTPQYEAQTTALRFADVNGNGTSDILWVNASEPADTRWQYLDINPLEKPNQLRIIDSGLGRRTTILYRSSTDCVIGARDAVPSRPWTRTIAFPVDVVSRTTTTASLDSDGQLGVDEYVTDFVYRDPYYDPCEKEFRGFGFVKKIERGGVGAPTKVSRFWFHTGAPDGVDNDDDRRVDERTSVGGAEEEGLKGRVLAVEEGTSDAGADDVRWDGIRAPNAVLFRRAENAWRLRMLNGPDGGTDGIKTVDAREVRFAFNGQEDAAIVERGTGATVMLRTTYVYDDYGNVLLKNEQGDLSKVGDERVTTSTYARDGARRILDRVSMTRVDDANEHRVKEVLRYYDGDPYQGLVLGVVGERGNLTREDAWVEGDTYIDTARAKYDQYGNRVGLLDPLGQLATSGEPDASKGHWREVQYDDTFHAFPTEERIHIGGGADALVTTAAYDVRFGVITAACDFNGVCTTYGYDSFGRLTSITKPPDSTDVPTVTYNYELSDPFRGLTYEYDAKGQLRDGKPTPTGPRASAVVTRLREETNNEANVLESATYIDGMGRTVAKVSEGENGFVVTDAVRFNARGTLRDTFQPYTTESLLYTAAPVSGSRTQTDYDAMGRETVRHHPPEPDGSIATVVTSYAPLSRTVMDELGNEGVHVTDGLERLVEVQEVNSEGEVKTSYVTQYAYNAADSLTRIVDAQDNVTIFTYDGLQRKTEVNQPDRGIMRYTYDAASNVIDSTDAKGQRILYAYDGANRLLTEDYRDAAGLIPDVRYQYDKVSRRVDAGDGTQVLPQFTKGALVAVRDLSGEEYLSYDSRGRTRWTIKRVKDPLAGVTRSYKTEMRYDAMDRLKSLIYPDNDKVDYIYNNRGLIEQITGGPSGFIINSVEYAPSGRVTRRDYGSGVATTYAYDERLRLTELRTAPSALPESPLLHYVYALDKASNIRAISDMRPMSAVPNGSPRRNGQEFTYDDLYRLTEARYSFAAPGGEPHEDGRIQYRYDRIGNMLGQTSTIVHTEDGKSVTTLGDMSYGGRGGTSGRVGREAGDPTDPRDSMPGPHALTATSTGRKYTYDDNGNMAGIDGLNATWDFKDRLVGVENDKVKAVYGYDYTDRRITKKVEFKVPTGNSATSSAQSAVYVNRHFEIRENGETIKYVFDGDTRVAQISGTLSAVSRVQRWSAYQGWNLLTLAVDAVDAAAQLGIGVEGSPIDKAHRWDVVGKGWSPILAGDPIAPGSVLWVHATTPASLQVRGTYGASSIGMIAEGASFVALPGEESINLTQDLGPEVNEVWAFDPAEQVWRLHLADDVAGLSDAPENVSPGAALYVRSSIASHVRLRDAAETIRYYHQDHLGSSNVVADGNGRLVEEIAYYPFGHPRKRYAPSDVTMVPTRYLFTQKEKDEESGLQYFEARFLAAHLARFVRVDPLVVEFPPRLARSPQALNSYSYARNHPMNHADPTGYDTVDKVEAVALTAVSAAMIASSVTAASVGAAGVALVYSYDLWTGQNNTGKIIEQLQKVVDPVKGFAREIGTETGDRLLEGDDIEPKQLVIDLAKDKVKETLEDVANDKMNKSLPKEDQETHTLVRGAKESAPVGDNAPDKVMERDVIAPLNESMD